MNEGRKRSGELCGVVHRMGAMEAAASDGERGDIGSRIKAGVAPHACRTEGVRTVGGWRWGG